MDYYVIIAIVPMGYSDKVIKSANKEGATGATVLHARGAENLLKEGLFSFKIEPEEEIVLIMVTKEISDAVCNRINEEFRTNCKRSGAIYILPINK